MAVRSGPERSPTTSIGHVLLAGAIGLLLALLLNARAVVHAGAGMTQGPLRAATLVIGRTALQAARTSHLTWPRDQLDAVLGRQAPPLVPPLLAGAGGPSPGTTPAPSVTPTAAALAALIAAPEAPPTATIGSRRCACPMATATTVVRRQGASAPPPATSRPSAGHASSAPAVPSTAPPRPTSAPRLAPATATNQPQRPVAAMPPRQVTAAAPLRLLVTGDSLTGYLGPELVDEAAAAGPVHGVVATHDGAGLTSPAYVDWSVVARQQVARDHPDAVVVLLGGNDFQNMTLPGGQFFLAGSSAWTQEYQRRASVCMQIWAQGGKARVYWLSMPPARNRQWALDDAQINIAVQRAAAQAPGVAYLNVLGPITDHGRYADFVQNAAGQTVLIREQDGVHLNIAGSTIVAQEVLPVIERDWRLLPATAKVGPRP